MYKACLATKDFTQTKDLDYRKTFSPIVKMTTIRTLLFIAFSQGWYLHQLGTNTIFLHRDLDGEVDMKSHPELITSPKNIVYKLYKSIYGLK